MNFFNKKETPIGASFQILQFLFISQSKPALRTFDHFMADAAEDRHCELFFIPSYFSILDIIRLYKLN